MLLSLTAAQALALIALGAFSQTEVRLTPIDLAIAAEAVFMTAAIMRMGQRRPVAVAEEPAEPVAVDEIRRRIGVAEQAAAVPQAHEDSRHPLWTPTLPRMRDARTEVTTDVSPNP